MSKKFGFSRNLVCFVVLFCFVLTSCGGVTPVPTPNPNPTPAPTPNLTPTPTPVKMTIRKNGKNVAYADLELTLPNCSNTFPITAKSDAYGNALFDVPSPCMNLSGELKISIKDPSGSTYTIHVDLKDTSKSIDLSDAVPVPNDESNVIELPTETSLNVSPVTQISPPTSDTPELPLPLSIFTPTLLGNTQIAFVREIDRIPQIFVVSFDASQIGAKELEISDPIQLTSNSYGACQPTWSPTGDFLLYVSPCKNFTPPRDKVSNYDGANIFIAEFTQNALQNDKRLISDAFDPDWSTSGILYASIDEQNRSHVYLADEAGTTDKNNPLTSLVSSDRYPHWLPNANPGEERFVFQALQLGREFIYWLNLSGENDLSRQQVSPSDPIRELPIRSPAWSVNNKVVYVFGDEGAKNLINVVNPYVGASVQPTTLKSDGFYNADPAWSSDGSLLAFASWRKEGQDYDIYITFDSGGNFEVRLTTAPEREYQPAWRP